MDTTSGAEERGIRSPIKHQKHRFKVGTSYFLGIGINAYRYVPQLRNAKQDVEDLAHLLESKYDVTQENTYTLYDQQASWQGIVRCLEKLRDRLQEADKLLIYFAGHGHIDRWKKGYWVPCDGDVRATSTLFSNSFLKEFLETIAARHILVISDSCYSGSLFYTGGQRGGSYNLADKLEARKSRWALCSGHQEEKVLDQGSDGNSPFAGAILRYLRENEAPKCRVSALADYVLEVTGSNYQQTAEGNPIYGVGHEGGQYVFRTKAIAHDDITILEGEELPAYRPARGIGKVYKRLNSDREEVGRWLVNWGKALVSLSLVLVIIASLISAPFLKQFLIALIPILYLLVPLWPLRFSELGRSNLFRLTSLHGLLYYSFLVWWKMGSGAAYPWWQFALMVIVGIVGALIIIPLKSKRK